MHIPINLLLIGATATAAITLSSCSTVDNVGNDVLQTTEGLATGATNTTGNLTRGAIDTTQTVGRGAANTTRNVGGHALRAAGEATQDVGQSLR